MLYTIDRIANLDLQEQYAYVGDFIEDYTGELLEHVEHVGHANSSHVERFSGSEEVEKKDTGFSEYELYGVHGDCCYWVIDLKSRNFKYISAQVIELMGWDISEFYREGLDALWRFIPDTERPYIASTLQFGLQHYQNLKSDCRGRQQYTSEIRLQKQNGNLIWAVLHIRILEEDEEGSARLLLCKMSDVSYLKSLKSLEYSRVEPRHFSLTTAISIPQVMEVDAETGTVHRSHLLTRRELYLIEQLANGESTKMMAKSLQTSPSTIDSHRRSMMLKTGTRDTSALVAYCKFLGWYWPMADYVKRYGR
jgi:DNA-binding CsgD family transcriptional regulator